MHEEEVPGSILTVLIKPRTVGALKEKGTVQEIERAVFSDPSQWRGSMDLKVSAANQRRQVWTRLPLEINSRYRNLENDSGREMFYPVLACFSYISYLPPNTGLSGIKGDFAALRDSRLANLWMCLHFPSKINCSLTLLICWLSFSQAGVRLNYSESCWSASCWQIPGMAHLRR